jgi:hypothetical protein
MRDPDLLRLRALEELRALERVWALFASYQAGLKPPKLASLRGTYDRHRRELSGIKDAPGSDGWERLATAAADAGRFEREVFCHAIGKLLHADGNGRPDVWAAADRLLTQLANRTGIADPPLTGLGFELGWESLTPLIGLVRLRYPGAGFWDLPVLAHEFGHHVLAGAAAVDPGDLLPLREAVGRFTAEQSSRHVLWRPVYREGEDQCQRRVAELVADVFATYAVGPAYPRCCVTLRIMPDDIDHLHPEHPPWRFRVPAMIEMLRVMSGRSHDRGYLRAVAGDVAALWETVAGPRADLGADSLLVVGRWVGEIADALGGVTGLRYDHGWLADQCPGAADGPPPGEWSVAHVLNAGWKWRLSSAYRTSDEVDAAERLFLGYCELVEA